MWISKRKPHLIVPLIKTPFHTIFIKVKLFEDEKNDYKPGTVESY